MILWVENLKIITSSLSRTHNGNVDRSLVLDGGNKPVIDATGKL
jgi:hypothetical protein